MAGALAPEERLAAVGVDPDSREGAGAALRGAPAAVAAGRNALVTADAVAAGGRAADAGREAGATGDTVPSAADRLLAAQGVSRGLAGEPAEVRAGNVVADRP